MKTFQGKQVILFIALVFPFFLYGQTDFRPGYIINLQHDTIKGLISFRTDLAHTTSCVFKKTATDECTIYLPGQIKSYRFTDGKYYVSSDQINYQFSKDIFIEFILKGAISILYYPDDLKDHFFIMKDTSIMELDHHNRLTGRAIEDVPMDSVPEKFRGQLKYLIQDQPSMFSKIDASNCYTKDLLTIAKDYQKLTCPDEECIQYEKRTRGNVVLKFAIHAGLGITHLKTPTFDGFKSDHSPDKYLSFNTALNYEIGIAFNIYLDYLDSRRFSLQFIPNFNSAHFESYVEKPLSSLLYKYDVDVTFKTINLPVLFKYSFYSSDWKAIPYIKAGVGWMVYFQEGEYINSSVPLSGNEDQELKFIYPFEKKAPNRINLISGIGTDVKLKNSMVSIGVTAMFSYGQLHSNRTDVMLQIQYQL